ncbi:amidase [Streptomyces albofaciens JCM 4342]|uniref:amidase n=1 Tax=Streptomyces albofaciens TaxID=66866 RepID=UPI00123971FD|nr:amidase [Streptomyces albofaciens]KAA6213120.1 amidase [Streptomyces albofaciens JCM 4342]
MGLRDNGDGSGDNGAGLRSGAAREYEGLAEQAAALAAGHVASVELVRRSLARIDATQGTVNAFRRVRAGAALAEAAAADRRLAAGERLPLLGVPVAVKDDTDVAGEPTAFGCAGEFPPKAADSEAVRRLRAAGAVIVGKTNACELGQWPFTEGPAFGDTRNPWNPGHTPGGSSGGSAAAVAAGLVPAALGTDGAGSVRIPAAWTHLVGIKPQRGRISTWPDPEAFQGITVLGPLARTVRDAALLLDAAAGSHDGDLHRPRPVAARAAADRDPGRLRIALSWKPAFTGTPKPLHPEVRSAVTALARTLAGLGHHVEEAEPDYGLIGLAFVPRATTGVREWVARAPDRTLLDRRTRGAARLGRLLGGPVLRRARAAERRQHRRVGALFGPYDLILTPTTAAPPPRIGTLAKMNGWQTDRAMIAACPYAWPWNVLGWPGISVPAGFTAGGLPLGAQLLGPSHSEPLLISLAAQLEGELRWYERWPEPGPVAGRPEAAGAGERAAGSGEWPVRARRGEPRPATAEDLGGAADAVGR